MWLLSVGPLLQKRHRSLAFSWHPVSKWLFQIAHTSVKISSKAHTSLTIYSKANLNVAASPHTLAFRMANLDFLSLKWSWKSHECCKCQQCISFLAHQMCSPALHHKLTNNPIKSSLQSEIVSANSVSTEIYKSQKINSIKGDIELIKD